MFRLLGRYDNFPLHIHGLARFTHASSLKTLQLTMAHVFYKLNGQTLDMRTLTKASPANCTVNFEFGVADADTFNFLDEEELKKLEHAVRHQSLQVLDAYCATRYQITDDSGKRKSLKFDYNMLRFAFYKRQIQLFVFHERGINRVPLEDLVLFLANLINQRLVEEQGRRLTLKRIHML